MDAGGAAVVSEVPTQLTSSVKHQLLRVARASAQAALGGPRYDESRDAGSVSGSYGGAFVTLWNGAALRGCIGRFVDTEDVATIVGEAGKAAVRDARFQLNPVRLAEMKKINVEVSVLSALVPTSDPASLVVGRDGIVVRAGDRSGCFLPKVASDKGWSAEEFLSNCCSLKAGLQPDAWRRPTTEVLVFTAQAFSESDVV